MYSELIRFSAAAELFHNDDTTARILERMGRRRERALHTSTSNDGEALDDRTPPDAAPRASLDAPADWLPWNYRETMAKLARADEVPALAHSVASH